MTKPAMITSPAVTDIIEGLSNWQLWVRIGWMDTLRRYRRTTLGPFWTSLSVAMFIGTVGVMYSQVFHQPVKTYLPYLSSGFVVWAPLSTYITESCGAFYGAEGILKQVKMPYSLFVGAAVVRNVIVFFHNFLVFVLVALLMGSPVNANSLLAIPALLLLVINAFWLGIVMSVVCARFRDMLQVVAALMQVAFFVTPIFWEAGQTSGLRAMFVDINLLYHFINILRAPLLGLAPTLLDWAAVLGATVAGWAFAVWLFNRYYNRIIFWM